MDLVPAAPDHALDPAAHRVRDYVSQAKARNTVRAYAVDWRHFQDWCRMLAHPSLPAEPVAVSFYLAELAQTARVSTVTRRLSAISQAHQLAGFPSPAQ